MKINGIIHIGAHYGEEVSEYISNEISNIILFEPLDENFDILLKKIKGFNGNIKCNKVALGSKRSHATMFVSSNDKQSSSILKPKSHLTQYPSITFNSTEIVEVHLLDDYDTQNFNFINIDVQGYELEVLKGGIKTLENIDYIYSEVNRNELYENGVLVEELDEFLYQYNFRRITTSWVGGTWGDALYIKQKV